MRKIRFDDNKKSGFFSRNGFYIALAICLLAVGAATWTAIGSISSPGGNGTLQNPPSVSLVDSGYPSDISSDTIGAENTVSDIPLPSIPPVSSIGPSSQAAAAEVSSAPISSSSAPASSSKAPASSALAKTYFVLPVSGDVIKPFSDTQLQYSKTYDDWRMHPGIDIAAEKGAQAIAAANGTVSDIYSDPVWGNVMIIDHGNGLMGYYCGLGKNMLVKKGAKVQAGNAIGVVDVIPCESLDPSHLHFGMQQKGKWVSPLQVMGMLQ